MLMGDKLRYLLGGDTSMLYPPLSQDRRAGVTDTQARETPDRSMDVLQYATACLALGVAILLAVFR